MSVRGPLLKNDPDRRMHGVMEQTSAFFPPGDFSKLDPHNFDHWIVTLRRNEAALRLLRKRLEALQAGSTRTCAYEDCGRQVTGRADKRYCNSECRVQAHRRTTFKSTEAHEHNPSEL